MQNLSEFKRRIADALKNGALVDVSSVQFTAYNVGHPLRIQFPEGKRVELTDKGRKVGRVQSNSFTTIRTSDEKESWMDWGKASEWTFSGDTATWAQSYEGSDHTHTTTIVFKFPAH